MSTADEICKWCGAPADDHDYEQVARYCDPAQINALEAEIARLRAALIKYGGHLAGVCQKSSKDPRVSKDVCTCGLSEILVNDEQGVDGK